MSERTVNFSVRVAYLQNDFCAADLVLVHLREDTLGELLELIDEARSLEVTYSLAFCHMAFGVGPEVQFVSQEGKPVDVGWKEVRVSGDEVYWVAEDMATGGTIESAPLDRRSIEELLKTLERGDNA